jgi:hypothetical protein
LIGVDGTALTGSAASTTAPSKNAAGDWHRAPTRRAIRSLLAERAMEEIAETLHISPKNHRL